MPTLDPSPWKTDCRHFLGDRPCAFRRECPGCPHYAPQGRRILVLKIGALGDVLRTTPILRSLAAGPGPVHVTWVTGPDAAPLLADHPRIDRLLVPSFETAEALGVERFDLVLSLDKDVWSTSLATRIAAGERRGFGRDGGGALVPLHPDARGAWELGLSDDFKFRRNDRTYPDWIHEVCGLVWQGQEYDVPAVAAGREAGRAALAAAGLGPGRGPVVGLNTGAAGVFANKAWTADGYAELARRLAADGMGVSLLGGARERERNARIAARSGGAAVDTGGDRDLPAFAGLVAAHDAIVTGDTLGLHLAIAAGVPVVAIFGSTCPQEIELYGRGEKVVTPIECHPCYRRSCDITPSCQDRVTVDAVEGALRRVLAASRAG